MEGEGPGRILPAGRGGGARGEALAGAPVRYRRIAHRVSAIVVRRWGRARAAEDARRVPEDRGRAEDEGATDRPDARAHAGRRSRVGVPAAVGVRRRGNGSEREEGRAELQGHDRIREVDGRVLA